jgi:four helix bundle protein
MAQHFKDLIAWQKAMNLVNAIYDATDAFPKRETYSLTDQIRRAAVSIPSNVAEGQAHYSNREFLHYLRHARGSLAELETQLLIAQHRNYLTDFQTQELLKLVNELSRILSGLINSLKEKETSNRN